MIFGFLVTISVAVIFFMATAFFAFKGFDASKENPQKLFMFYIQKQVPASVKEVSATGHSFPIGGTGITFRFKIDLADLDRLILAKKLQRSEEPFQFDDSGDLKQSEFYWTDTDTTWSSSRSSVRMGVDRKSGLVIYEVLSP
jgi:hypothetical protein